MRATHAPAAQLAGCHCPASQDALPTSSPEVTTLLSLFFPVLSVLTHMHTSLTPPCSLSVLKFLKCALCYTVSDLLSPPYYRFETDPRSSAELGPATFRTGASPLPLGPLPLPSLQWPPGCLQGLHYRHPGGAPGARRPAWERSCRSRVRTPGSPEGLCWRAPRGSASPAAAHTFHSTDTARC